MSNVRGSWGGTEKKNSGKTTGAIVVTMNRSIPSSWLKTLKEKKVLASIWFTERPNTRIYFPLVIVTLIVGNIIFTKARKNDEQRILMQTHHKLLNQQKLNIHKELKRLKEKEDQIEYTVHINPLGEEKLAKIDVEQFLTDLFPNLVEQKKKLNERGKHH